MASCKNFISLQLSFIALAYDFRSNNGRLLFITSFDCYCSVITFSEGELGTKVSPSLLPANLLSDDASEAKEQPSVKLNEPEKGGQLEMKVSSVELTGTPSPSRLDSNLDPPKPSGKTPRRIRPTQLSSFTSPGTSGNEICTNSKTPPPSSSSAPPTTSAVDQSVSSREGSVNQAPRRVNFVTLAKFNEGQSSPKTTSTCSQQVDCGRGKESGEPMEIQTTE